MKHIVIDARLYGPKHTGLGRYTKNLLVSIAKLPDFSEYKFTLLVYPEILPEIKKDLGKKFTYISTDIRHYTLQEQIFLPRLLRSLNPDLVHFTHLDKPLFYSGLSVVTVHDLIRHFSKGSATTTKNHLFYWLKYLGYLLMTQRIFKTSYLIVPSNFWRNYIINHYHFSPQKIITTYEAVDPHFLSSPKTKISPAKPYIVYTGNLYPHKNISVILEALRFIPEISLKIICARSVFADRIEKMISDYHLQKRVEFLGFVPDTEFAKIYSSALALVHPSFLEGFSLTGLEAMALNCPVISSDSSCLPEIYENSVLYFNPKDPQDLVKQIRKLYQNPPLRKLLITSGQNQVKKFSWNKTATETLNYYQQILHA